MIMKFLKYIRMIDDFDTLDQIIVILKVRQVFIQYPPMIELNKRCYNLFSSAEKVTSVLPSKDGISVTEFGRYITGINDVASLERLIVEVCYYYCSKFCHAPITSNTDFVLSFLVKNDQKTKYLLNPYLQATYYSEKSEKSFQYSECVHQTIFTKRRLSFADVSFHNPSFTSRSMFDVCEISQNEIDPFFDDDSIGNALIQVIEQSKDKPNQPTYLKAPDGQKFQSLFYPYENFFEVCIFDTAKPSDDMKGTSKYIRPDNFVFLIKNIPLYSWFIGCQGETSVAKGWQFVRLDRASPILCQQNLAPAVSVSRRVSHPVVGSALLLPQMPRRLSTPTAKVVNIDTEISLREEGFIPFTKNNKKIFIAPYKGCNLDVFKKNGGHIDFEFLNQLNHFLFRNIESSNFEKIHDIKPQNILFASHKRIFSLIDYKKDSITPMFCRFQCHKIAKSDPEFSKKTAIHTLADNVVMTTYYLLDNNPIETGNFYHQFFLTCFSYKLTHDFYKYLKETIFDLTSNKLGPT